MLAGGLTGSSNVMLLAQALKTDVMFDTGTGNTPHVANGSNWYYNSSFSWGFAPEGAPISRNSCDTNRAPGFGALDASTPLRLCWHTFGGRLTGGWRIGGLTFLNSGNTYTRYIFTSNNPTYAPVGPQTTYVATSVPEPVTSAALIFGVAGAMTLVRRSRRR
ncbi:hypothetical protein F183_A33380 [Bryobacterales bacterium F-183]|nr:hypothetical protein F183_A33380 [Bryobacterales bacterium F-183]